MTVFISYRRIDSTEVVGRIYDRLAQTFDTRAIFRDIGSIPPSRDFREVIINGVGACRVLLAVIEVQTG